MASENAEDTSVATAAPEALVRWLEETASDLELSREELVAGLLAAARSLDEGGTADHVVVRELDLLEERLAALESEYREDIEDVRERVVQVKLEADERAPVDHDHDDLREQLAATDSRIEAVESSVEALDEELTAGFENYEEVLSYLTETTDDLEAKLHTLGRAVVDVRETVQTLAEREAGRVAAEELAATANRNGIRTATCGECDRTVDVGLLAAPECPHCGSTFADLEPKGGVLGFFGSGVLVVGDPPALEAGDDDLVLDFDEWGDVVVGSDEP